MRLSSFGNQAGLNGASPASPARSPRIENQKIGNNRTRPPVIHSEGASNRDEEPHLVVSVGGAFKPSQALDTGDSFSAVLAKPGTYEYFCGMHPQMVGRIVVQ
jgi:hypothetical protein